MTNVGTAGVPAAGVAPAAATPAMPAMSVGSHSGAGSPADDAACRVEVVGEGERQAVGHQDHRELVARVVLRVLLGVLDRALERGPVGV